VESTFHPGWAVLVDEAIADLVDQGHQRGAFGRGALPPVLDDSMRDDQGVSTADGVAVRNRERQLV